MPNLLVRAMLVVLIGGMAVQRSGVPFHFDPINLAGVDKKIWVFVGDLPPDSPALGLTKEQLKTDIEFRLRIAGFQVLDKTGGRIAEDDLGKFRVTTPMLTLEVMLSPVAPDGSFVYGMELALYENVAIHRSPRRIYRSAETWYKKAAGTGYDRDDIRNKVRDFTEVFANEYLRDNPRTPPPAEKKPEEAKP